MLSRPGMRELISMLNQISIDKRRRLPQCLVHDIPDLLSLAICIECIKFDIIGWGFLPNVNIHPEDS